jgi:hypothetical protein
MKALSEAERRFHSMYQLCAQVRPHGFEAYFGSLAGDNASIARDSFIEIGAVRTAAVVDQAVAVFPGGLPSDLAQRRAKIAETAGFARPIWQRCDSEIARINEPLKRLMVDYAKKKKSEFVFR